MPCVLILYAPHASGSIIPNEYHNIRFTGSRDQVVTINYFFRKMFEKNRDMILSEGRFFNDFIHLVFKERNTSEKWTDEELRLLRRHLRHLTAYIPGLIIFFLPGSMLLLPVLAEAIDRRKHLRDSQKAEAFLQEQQRLMRLIDENIK